MQGIRNEIRKINEIDKRVIYVWISFYTVINAQLPFCPNFAAFAAFVAYLLCCRWAWLLGTRKRFEGRGGSIDCPEWN